MIFDAMLLVGGLVVGAIGGGVISSRYVTYFCDECDDRIDDLERENANLASRLTEAGLKIHELTEKLRAGGNAKAAKACAAVQSKTAQLRSEIAAREATTTAREGSNHGV